MNISLKQFLENGIQHGGFNNEDLVAIFIPLFKTIVNFHDEGKTATDNLIKQIQVLNGVLHLNENNFKFHSLKTFQNIKSCPIFK